MRLEYSFKGLSEEDLADDPLDQFGLWLAEAVAADVHEPNAMVVSTVDSAGRPSSRHLLLKGITQGGFEFYTNTQSAKGQDLAGNPALALTFPWLDLQRQVNIVGVAERLTDAENDAYFAQRPRQTQIGAWASNQSRILADRAELDRAVVAAAERFAVAVPRPPYWGGYRVQPTMIEFWQGRPNRLHDRLRYSRGANSDGVAWTVTRLSP